MQHSYLQGIGTAVRLCPEHRMLVVVLWEKKWRDFLGPPTAQWRCHEAHVHVDAFEECAVWMILVCYNIFRQCVQVWVMSLFVRMPVSLTAMQACNWMCSLSVRRTTHGKDAPLSEKALVPSDRLSDGKSIHAGRSPPNRS